MKSCIGIGAKKRERVKMKNPSCHVLTILKPIMKLHVSIFAFDTSDLGVENSNDYDVGTIVTNINQLSDKQ